MSRYLFVLVALLFVCSGWCAAQADVITEWNNEATVVLEEETRTARWRRAVCDGAVGDVRRGERGH